MIDFHTHIFPDEVARKSMPHLAEVCKTVPHTDGTKDGLVKSTQDAGIDCSIILPVVTAPKQFDSIHRFAMQFRTGSLISFGGIHPEHDDYKDKIRWIKEQGFLGIKLQPDYQSTYFNDIRYKRIISFATELDMIVLTHAGLDPLCPNDIHCTPKMAAEVIDEVKPTKLVLAHMGGLALYDESEQYLVGKDVYFDTAYVLDKMKEEQLVRMIKNHGVDKVLFASDSPWGGQQKFVDCFEKLPLSKDAKTKILHTNASKLLGIEI